MQNRREFLKYSSLFGAAAASFSPWAASAIAADGDVVGTTNGGDTYTVSLGSLRADVTPARKIVIPDVDGFKVLKGDFHMHTLFSDGYVMPKDRVAEAVDNGLDVIAITDHIEYRPHFSKIGKWKLTDKQASDYNLWYDDAKPEAEKRELLLVRGTEITKQTMPPGHFNALFASDNNPIAAAVDDWKTMLQVAVDNGAFLLWNHPGWEAPKSGGIEPGAPLRFTDAHEEIYKKGLMHGIEVFNGTQYYPVVPNWCHERNLAMFANSDIHVSEEKQYGLRNTLRPITLVLAKERTVDSVKEAFFAKRTIAWAADLIWGSEELLAKLFKASVTMKSITPGTLEFTNTSSLPVAITVGGSVVSLKQNVKRQVYRAAETSTLTVTNWMTGMDKPLVCKIV
ncbi:MAG: PHP domain-containing protein [Planctomycetaceae bacterium]|jgi:predicted metal-dependent phosphoesterase TrpH|nr:PHP domain-containing protein [Planctomycetaceae bacterium]